MPTRIRPPILLLAALLATAATALASCGDDNRDVGEVLDAAFSSKATSIDSAKISAALDFRPPGGDQAISVKLDGPFESAGDGKLPRFDIGAALGIGGQTISAGIVSTGNAGFVELQGTTYAVTGPIFTAFKQAYEQASAAAGKSSKKSGGSSADPSLRSLGIDPRNWLRSERIAGEEKVAGVATDHVRGDVDLGRLVDDLNKLLSKAGALQIDPTGELPTSISPKQKAALEKAVKRASFDVWVGKDDDIIRRLRVAISLAEGKEQTDIGFTLELSDVGDEQTIVAPKGAKPIDELLSQLGGLGLPGLGGLGGSSDSGSSSATPPGQAPVAPDGDAAAAYVECLTKADQDIKATQKCAKLLE